MAMFTMLNNVLFLFNFTMLLHLSSPRNPQVASPLSPSRPIRHLHQMEKNTGCWQVGKVVLIKALTTPCVCSVQNSSDFPDDLLAILQDSIYCEVQNSIATKKIHGSWDVMM